MKTFKMVLNCVLPTLLVFSIVLNILLLCGFEFTRPTQNNELNTDTTSPIVNDIDNDIDPSLNNEDDKVSDNEVSTPDVVEDETVGTLIYDDTNIKVTYMSTQKKDGNVIHNFKIDNLTKKTLTVSFVDVTINDVRVYISGLTCENLLPETSSVEEFVLYEKDWTNFTEDPSDVSFKIELVNSKSRLDWYESNVISMKF